MAGRAPATARMMKTLPRILLLLLALGLSQPPSASAQSSMPGGGESPADSEAADAAAQIPVDSLAIAAAAAAAAAGANADALADSGGRPSRPNFPTSSLGVHPIFKSSTTAGDTRVDLRNSLSISLAYPNTWAIGGDIKYNRTIPREVQQETRTTGYSLNMSKQLIEGVPIRISASQNIGLSEQNKDTNNYRRDETSDSQMLFSTSGGKAITGWLGANANTSVSVSESEANNNQGLNRTSSNGMRQFASHIDVMPISGMKITSGFTGTLNSGTAELVGIRDDVKTTNDSLQLKVDYRIQSKLTISLVGGRKKSDAERLDFRRNQFNIVDSDSIPIKEQTTDSDIGGNFRVHYTPSARIDLTVSANGSTTERRVTNTDSKDKDGESQGYDLALKLSPWGRQQLNFSFKESSTKTLDFTANREQTKKELFVTSNQALGESFSFGGEAYYLLSQDFYANTQLNPQDRDQAQTRLAMNINGKVARWLSAKNTVRWTENRDILIQPERSIGSKDRRSLAWASKIDYDFFTKFKLNQSYEVTVTEEDFIFTQDKNALDKKYVVITTANVPLYGRIRLDFSHEFRKVERGGYLPDPDVTGNPKTFFRETREKKEFLRLGISYNYREYLTLSIRDELGRTVGFDYEDLTQDLSSFGTLDFAMRFTKKLGANGNLAFSLDHKARFGKFIRENKRRVWLPALTVDYNF